MSLTLYWLQCGGCGGDTMSLLKIKWGRTVVGIGFTLLASVVCIWNFYLHVVGPWDYNRVRPFFQHVAEEVVPVLVQMFHDDLTSLLRCTTSCLALQ